MSSSLHQQFDHIKPPADTAKKSNVANSDWDCSSCSLNYIANTTGLQNSSLGSYRELDPFSLPRKEGQKEGRKVEVDDTENHNRGSYAQNKEVKNDVYMSGDQCRQK